MHQKHPMYVSFKKSNTCDCSQKRRGEREDGVEKNEELIANFFPTLIHEKYQHTDPNNWKIFKQGKPLAWPSDSGGKEIK